MLLVRFWIIFIIITLTSFSNRLFPLHFFGLVSFYHVPSSATCSSVFSFCLIYCVWSLLSAGWMVVAPLDCGVRPHEWGWTSATCRLPGWEDLCLLLVTGVGPCCSEGQCHMGSAWLWAACLLTGRAVFLFYWWFGVWHLALGLAGLWLGLGLSVEMTAFERVLMS